MVSVIVCTYNRAATLKDCLTFLELYSRNYNELLEFIIVDNASADDTANVVSRFMDKKNINIRYLYEAEQGLAAARNRGAREARYEWLFFLDDDGFVNEDTFDQLFYTLENYDFDFFGGTYAAHFTSPGPRWLPEDFGSKKVIATQIAYLDKDTIEGGIMVIRKKVLTDTGYFNTSLGMKGIKEGFGEEREWITRASAAGYKAGFNPFFSMRHLIHPRKYKVWFQLKSYFALGRDSGKSGQVLQVNAMRVYSLLPFRIIKYAWRLLRDKNFYLENFYWNIFGTIFYVTGYYLGKLDKTNG
ncbi:MAG: glycosyltransferase family 2 protein [Saprospiraceae bacterium]|nr:glycosyltransferase family 2 protein [Saprospiraceae bacterium]